MWFIKLLFSIFVSQVISYSIKEIESNKHSHIDDVPPSFNNELPCLAIGGYCVHINKCPEESRSFVKGLCPMQEQQGVECCDLRSKKVEHCTKEGGKCVSRYADCEEKITFFEGGDCAINEKCC